MQDSDLISRCAAVVQTQIKKVEANVACVRVPKLIGERRRIPGSPFHAYPELFFQISGITAFTFPQQRLTLEPGEMCVIPRLLPHTERVSGKKGAPFSNMVMMLSADTASFHTAAESPRRRGTPCVFQAERFDYVGSARLAEPLDEIVAFSTRVVEGDSLSLQVTSHLVLGFLHKLLVLFRDGIRLSVTGHPKVIAAKNQIALNISNPALSVKTLADWLQCSPDYLSALFHDDAGETLIRYITRKRMAMAKSLLQTSLLTISETAWACGYHDAAYFCRVFRALTGASPGQFRAHGEAVSQEALDGATAGPS